MCGDGCVHVRHARACDFKSNTGPTHAAQQKTRRTQNPPIPLVLRGVFNKVPAMSSTVVIWGLEPVKKMLSRPVFLPKIVGPGPTFA